MEASSRVMVRAGRRLAGCVLGLALVSLIAASASLADNPVVTATSVTSMNANASAVLTGTSISGYSNASQPLLVSVSTTIGSLSMTQTSGLTLSYGYSTFSGSCRRGLRRSR